MPDLWMDVDAGLSEVPVNIFPLIDDTDFKTIETGVAYNESGMDLVWNFITPAGAMTQTAVTPTTGGDYDWSHQGDGMYSIEIPASGGASINNDTEGFGWFSGVCDGVLPWRGPTIGFRAAGLNNLLVEDAFSATRGLAGTALPDAAADAAGGLPISDAGGLDIDKFVQVLYPEAAVYLSATDGASGTTDYVNGTVGNPADTMANAKTIADSLGYKKIIILDDTSYDLNASTWSSGYTIIGKNSETALDLNSQTVDGMQIHGIEVFGTASTNAGQNYLYTTDCVLYNGTFPKLKAFRCRLENDITVGETGVYEFVNCHDARGGSNDLQIDFGSGVGATTMIVSGFSGNITVKNMGSGDVLRFFGQGAITFDNTNTDGTAQVGGPMTITDNSGGTFAITEDVSDVNVTHINGDATDGNNATLSLKQLNIVNDSGDAIYAKAEGNNGDGLHVEGNLYGDGIHSLGGSKGDGAYMQSGDTEGHGLNIESRMEEGMYVKGLGDGIFASSRCGGSGIVAVGLGAPGMECRGADNYPGLKLKGGNTGNGLTAEGGDGGGNGIHSEAVAGNGHGTYSKGEGSGHGAFYYAGATGDGMKAEGLDGQGIYALSATFQGIYARGGAVGLLADSISNGQGMEARSGPNGGYGFWIRGLSVNTDALKCSGTLRDIEAAEIGVPADLGDGASLADNMTSLAGKTAWAGSYDRTTDSQEAIRDSVGALPSAADNADAVWDEARADHTSAGTFGEGVKVEELNTQAKADVNAECLDVVSIDTIAELAAAKPPKNPTMREAIMLQYMGIRNAATETATEQKIFNDAGTEIAKKTMSDDGTTFTSGQMAAP